MGLTISRKKTTNSNMVDDLEHRTHIKSQKVEGAFRAVDRAWYFEIDSDDDDDSMNPYDDEPWRRGNLHLSSPSVYAKVVEALDLNPGLSFLNLGSGTGYLNTIVGLLVGPNGVNHGIEFHLDVVEYANKKLELFKEKSFALDKYDFVEPLFVHGNCLNLSPSTPKYDRIYLGAACLPDLETYMKNLIKPNGGILVMPYDDHLTRYTRISDKEWKTEKLMDVNFALMIRSNDNLNLNNSPICSHNNTLFTMPLNQAKSLKEICRSKIRQLLRDRTNRLNPYLLNTDNVIERKKRKERLERKLFKEKVRQAENKAFQADFKSYHRHETSKLPVYNKNVAPKRTLPSIDRYKPKSSDLPKTATRRRRSRIDTTNQRCAASRESSEDNEPYINHGDNDNHDDNDDDYNLSANNMSSLSGRNDTSTQTEDCPRTRPFVCNLRSGSIENRRNLGPIGPHRRRISQFMERLMTSSPSSSENSSIFEGDGNNKDDDDEAEEDEEDIDYDNFPGQQLFNNNEVIINWPIHLRTQRYEDDLAQLEREVGDQNYFLTTSPEYDEREEDDEVDDDDDDGRSIAFSNLSRILNNNDNETRNNIEDEARFLSDEDDDLNLFSDYEADTNEDGRDTSNRSNVLAAIFRGADGPNGAEDDQGNESSSSDSDNWFTINKCRQESMHILWEEFMAKSRRQSHGSAPMAAASSGTSLPQPSTSKNDGDEPVSRRLRSQGATRAGLGTSQVQGEHRDDALPGTSGSSTQPASRKVLPRARKSSCTRSSIKSRLENFGLDEFKQRKRKRRNTDSSSSSSASSHPDFRSRKSQQHSKATRSSLITRQPQPSTSASSSGSNLNDTRKRRQNLVASKVNSRDNLTCTRRLEASNVRSARTSLIRQQQDRSSPLPAASSAAASSPSGSACTGSIQPRTRPNLAGPEWMSSLSVMSHGLHLQEIRRRRLRRRMREKKLRRRDLLKEMKKEQEQLVNENNRLNGANRVRRSSTRRGENECERYHNHLSDYIRQLPLPKVLKNYLNYDRKL